MAGRQAPKNKRNLVKAQRRTQSMNQALWQSPAPRRADKTQAAAAPADNHIKERERHKSRQEHGTLCGCKVCVKSWSESQLEKIAWERNHPQPPHNISPLTIPIMFGMGMITGVHLAAIDN